MSRKKHKGSRHGSNPVVIRPDTKIGNVSAETDDEFLFRCFVDHPAKSTASDLDNSQMFVSGRTGAGKTAILRMIEKDQRNVAIVDLPELSMNYIANSDIMRFLNSLDIDLDMFFQYLWKHIILIEYIRLRFSITNEEESKNVFVKLVEYFKNDQRKRESLEYLRKWEGKFWITMDENIREVTEKLEEDVEANLGTEVSKFRANAGYSRTLSKEKRAQVQARAKQIISSDQLNELAQVMGALRDYDKDEKYGHDFYILIDKLDENWVDEQIRFELIRALVETLRSVRKLRKLKVIVSIRSDVLERVFQNSRETGFQREKYDDYIVRIIWREKMLRELVQKRISFLYSRKYTKENVLFSDIFSHKVGGKDPLSYMLDRTLFRPRDIISFVNICFNQAQGNTEVLARDIRTAEQEYSRLRLQALREEWRGALPSLEVALSAYGKFGRRFTIGNVTTREFVDDLMLNVAALQDSDHDPIVRKSLEYVDKPNGNVVWDLGRIVTCELYRIGAIGVRTDVSGRFIYSHVHDPVIGTEMIDKDTRIHIHPMLHAALNLADQQ